MKSAASTPVQSECAPARRKTPAAAIARSAADTRAASSRSSIQPVVTRPTRLAKPIADTAIAPPAADTPRSTSSATMCTKAPLVAIVPANKTATNVQKTRVRSASRTETPAVTAVAGPFGNRRSPMNMTAVGSAIRTVADPHNSHAILQPYILINAWAIIGVTIPDSAAPVSVKPSARPRSASNQLNTARDGPIVEAPSVARPSAAKTSRKCQTDGVSTDSDATAQPDSARHGRITRRAPTRSRRRPIQGAEKAATSVSVPNADEAASLDHEKCSDTGLRNTAKVLSGIVAKNVPTAQATTTRQPS